LKTLRDSLKESNYKNIWLSEFNNIIRGMCGGFLFGIPLLYTMEVWWIGSSATPRMMAIALVSTFFVVFLLNRTDGFRKKRRVNQPYESVIETVEAMAIGLVCSAFLLSILQELNLDTSIHEAVGKVIYESVPFSIGVALANKFLGDSRNSQSQDKQQKDKRNNDELNATLSDIGATLIGGMVIAFNIAPTDEVPMLAAAFSEPWLLVIIIVSLIISYAIVFESGFSDQKKRRQQRGIFQRPLSETFACYIVSLFASAFMLWFFQRLTFDDPWTMWLNYSILLGLPATVGGAAGRLAV
jgi:putative integral membrane protein (TIGR02587 family)